jgi:hypothetical protein
MDGRCACLCGRPITEVSPSAFFATETCARWWHATQRIGIGPQREPEPGSLGQLAAMIERFFWDTWQALQPVGQAFVGLAAAVVEAADTLIDAVPPPPPPPKTGPPPRRRPPKAITPGGGWYSHARSAHRHRWR